MENSRSACRLELLPAEIRRHLLYVLPYEQLCSLIRSSPVYHKQYLLDRKSILSRLLESVSNGTGKEICAVSKSSLADCGEINTKGDVVKFLDLYEANSDSIAKLTTEQIAYGARFQFTVIDPMIECYTAWTCKNVRAQYGVFRCSDQRDTHELSDTERRRVTRAMYRFQLFCNLFGKGCPSRDGFCLCFQRKEILQVFFDLYEPWEVESIYCIYTFVEEWYNSLFEEIASDVHPDNPRFDNQSRPPTPIGAFDLQNPYQREIWLEGAASHGLARLREVLTIDVANDRDHLVTILQNTISELGDNFIRDALEETPQSQRREEQTSARDAKQMRREPLPFKGDNFSGDDSSHPPLAWTMLWDGVYSNLVGFYIPDAIRRFGYVIWDADRMDRIGLKTLVMAHWDEYWGMTRDPHELIS